MKSSGSGTIVSGGAFKIKLTAIALTRIGKCATDPTSYVFSLSETFSLEVESDSQERYTIWNLDSATRSFS